MSETWPQRVAGGKASCLPQSYAMDLSKKEIDDIRYATILHDIGKIGVPGYILRKPTKLTAKEYKTIQKHPAMGEEIIRSVRFLKDAAPAIRHHHEFLNGKGYPDGLKGEKIPLNARILAVSDAFDAIGPIEKQSLRIWLLKNHGDFPAHNLILGIETTKPLPYACWHDSIYLQPQEGLQYDMETFLYEPPSHTFSRQAPEGPFLTCLFYPVYPSL